MKYVTFVGPHPAKSTVISPKPAVERSGQKGVCFANIFILGPPCASLITGPCLFM